MRIRPWTWRLLLLLPLLGLGGMLPAQLRGTVRDAESGDSLAFAYVLALQSQKGCFTGLDGRFSLDLAQPDSLRISLLGYRPATVWAQPGTPLAVALQPGGLSLSDVVITPSENPALRIVRNAVARRNDNDPAIRSDYSYDSYNKLVGTPSYAKALPDSLQLDIHIFLSETATHRVQLRPGKVQETITSARLAGYPGKVIPLTASDLQDISLYGNYLGVLGQRYLSPISPAGLNQYAYRLCDTLVVGEDSIFTIAVQPARDNFDALEGTMRIHSADWALTTADFSLVTRESSLLVKDGEIRQVYQALPTGEWVPTELFTEVDTRPLSKSDPMAFHFSGYSRLSRHALGDSLHRVPRPEDHLLVADGAGREDSLLGASRSLPLSPKDSLTYQKLDSLGKAFGLPRVFDLTWKLGQGRFGLGPVDLMLERIFLQDRVEQYRLGLGLVTNDKVSRRFSVGGFGAYGTRDKEWKYGGMAMLTPFGDDRLHAGVAYSHDLVETGWRRLGLRPERPLTQDIYRELGIRRWYLSDMDYVTSREAWAGVRLPGDLSLRAGRRMEAVVPAYDYRFADSSRFAFDEWEALLRWAPGARYIRDGNRRVLNALKGPVMSLRLTQGLDGRHGDYAYRAAAISVQHRFRAFRGGQMTYLVHAGWADRSLPRARMRNYRGTFAPRNFTDLQGAFNTMRFDEFGADMYAEAFVYLQPKLRWLRFGEAVHPRVYLSMAAGWGQLHAGSAGLHAPMSVVAPHKLYLEPGISINNLLPTRRDDSLLSAYIGALGVGVYYRVGAYSLPTFKENIALRLSWGLL